MGLHKYDCGGRKVFFKLFLGGEGGKGVKWRLALDCGLGPMKRAT